MRNPILRLQQSRDRIVSRRRTPHTGPFLAIFDMDDNRLSVGDGTAECGAGAEGWRTRPALALRFQSWGRSMPVAIEGFVGPARRKVAIRRDQEDYVIVVQPEDLVLFRNPVQLHFARLVIFFAGRLSAILIRMRMIRRLGKTAICVGG